MSLGIHLISQYGDELHLFVAIFAIRLHLGQAGWVKQEVNRPASGPPH